MKYYINTYGCQMNESDSERIAAVLEKFGYRRSKKETKTDLSVINACSVRQSAIDRVNSKIRKLRRETPKTKILLTGCLLEKDRERLTGEVDIIFNIKGLTKLLLGPKLQVPKPKLTTNYRGYDYFKIIPSYPNKSEAYVPIMTGCNNFCSYCVVPYTRGREYSRPAGEIIKEAEALIKKGYKEIILLGQNVNSYRGKFKMQNAKAKFVSNCHSERARRLADERRIPTINFSKLLKIMSSIAGNFKISFLTSHPKDMSDELIKTITQCEKVKKLIHLPIQSGDNKILKAMNRGYTGEKYLALLKKIRRAIPKVKITTDIIVGFPGETKRQFQNTIKLCKKAKFSSAYIARYSPRPGTNAFKLKDDVSPKEKKRRWQILEDLINKPHLKTKEPKKPLITILGPTASGKSDLAIRVAKKFNGEIVSADSRQIYKEMDVGTSKIKNEKGIPHYMIDIVKPDQEFTLSQYKKMTLEIISDIHKRGKIPFLVGGTGLYVSALVDNLSIPQVPPDKKLRKGLEKFSSRQLFKKLEQLDPETASVIDKNNKRRLIRALEVVIKTKESFSSQKKKGIPLFDILQIGLKIPQEKLYQRINQRVEGMCKAGLIKEVKKLAKKYAWSLPSMSGIGYQEIGRYLRKEISLEEAAELIKKNTRRYSRRQMTWFRRDKRICWIKSYKQALILTEKFLKTK